MGNRSEKGRGNKQSRIDEINREKDVDLTLLEWVEIAQDRGTECLQSKLNINGTKGETKAI